MLMQTSQSTNAIRYVPWLVAIGSCLLAIAWLNTNASPKPSPESYPLTALEDTFVYEGNPDANYGSAGALAIAGPGASSDASEKMFETFIQFQTINFKSHFDKVIGSSDWEVESLTLKLDWAFEAGAKPGNELFRSPISEKPRLTVSWVSDSGWSQGGGRPREPQFPATTTDGLTWNNSRLMAGASQSLAEETLEYPSTSIELKLIEYLRLALNAGRNITLRLSPATPDTNILLVSSQKGLGGNGTLLEVKASRKNEHE
jgi:hypothetical protein